MPSRLRPRRSERGFGDARLALGIAVVGSLAVGAVAGVRRYIHEARTAEPRQVILQIAQAAARAYQENTGPDGRHRLCPSSGFVPADAEAVRGRSYQSSRADWADDSAHAGWTCLGFELDAPQRYRYHYESWGGGGPGASYVITAEGDLDGDETVSRFSLYGVVNANGELHTDPNVTEQSPYVE